MKKIADTLVPRMFIPEPTRGEVLARAEGNPLFLEELLRMVLPAEEAGRKRTWTFGADPTQPDYIGRHPGTAFLELQFYPPGWVPFQNAISCDATQWCAAMAIFSFDRNQNTFVDNNAACLNTVGLEPANFAFITTSGA